MADGDYERTDARRAEIDRLRRIIAASRANAPAGDAQRREGPSAIGKSRQLQPTLP